MSSESIDMLVRLAVAAGLSGIIGFEREVAHKNAGLRTHMLVGLGAAVFTLLSLEFPRSPVSDPARIAAQIVTGVGFLGAGAIFRFGLSVRGLTTAAGLWLAAAVGMAAGAGEFFMAVVATAIAIAVLYLVGIAQWLFRGRRDQATTVLRIRLAAPAFVDNVRSAAQELIQRGEVDIHEIGDERATLHCNVEPGMANELIQQLIEFPGVERVFREQG